MQKKDLFMILAMFLFVMDTFAAGTFTCEVFEKTVFSHDCVVCVQRNGDNDCVKEIETQCLSTKLVSTKVKDQRAVSGNNVNLGKKEKNFSFILGASDSGFSARVTSEKQNVEATLSSTTKIDLYEDNFSLAAKTKQNERVVGNVTEVQLNCRPF